MICTIKENIQPIKIHPCFEYAYNYRIIYYIHKYQQSAEYQNQQNQYWNKVTIMNIEESHLSTISIIQVVCAIIITRVNWCQ